MLGSKNSEKYDACPYCLTEITVEEDTKTLGVQKEKEEIKIEQTEIRKIEKQTTQKLQKTEGCLHYMGYLSQRSTKEKIPEECIVCQNIVQCMLKNVTG
jgi:hypothetical protein